MQLLIIEFDKELATLEAKTKMLWLTLALKIIGTVVLVTHIKLSSTILSRK